MLAPTVMRRSMAGLPSILLAVLFVVTRLLASSMAMAAPSHDAPATIGVLCHASPDTDADGKAPVHDACLVCPACHLASHAGLPAPVPAMVPQVVGSAIGLAAAPPPATAPPPRYRAAAPPTGPPTLPL